LGVSETALAVTAAARRDSDESLDQEKTDLTWRVKVTSGSRFNASKRLSSRDAKISFLNAVASVAVIFLSVVSATVKTGELLGITLTLFTILASIAILVTSLFQYALKDAVNAERMQTCGLKLSELRYRMLYSKVTSREQLLAFMNDYNSVLSQYPNHEESDYQRYRDEHPNEFTNRPDRGTGPGGARVQKAMSLALSMTIIVFGISTTIVTLIALIRWRGLP
jgi:uncharacterized Tic20 family protein